MKHFLSISAISIIVSVFFTACTNPMLSPAPLLSTVATAPSDSSATASPVPSAIPTPVSHQLTVTQIAQLGKGQPSRVIYSPNGSLLAVGTSVGIYLYNAETLEELRFIETGAEVDSLAFSPNGDTIVSGDHYGENFVRLWDTNTGQLIHIFKGHTERVYSVAFSPDGHMLASSGNGIRWWDVDTGQLLYLLEPGGAFLSFSPDGKILASAGGSAGMQLWDANTGKQLRTLKGDYAAFSSDGRTIASGASYGIGLDRKTVWLWDVESGRQLRTITGAVYVSKLTYSPDGNVLAGSSDNKVWLWDPKTGRLLRKVDGSVDMAFSPDSRTLVSVGNDRVVRIWNARTGQLLHTLNDFTDVMLSVAFSPDGRVLAAASGDHAIQQWDVSTSLTTGVVQPLQVGTDDADNQLLRTLTQTTGSSVAISPDGRTIASGEGYPEFAIRLRIANTGEVFKTLLGHANAVYGVAFSPDGNLLASASADHTVRLWDVNAGTAILTLNGHTDIVTSVAFDPNGDLLVSGSNDNTIRLWDTSTGQLLVTLKRHTSRLYSVAFSPDGKMIASASHDGTVRLWKVVRQ